jgi:hypothetical protein
VTTPDPPPVRTQAADSAQHERELIKRFRDFAEGREHGFALSDQVSLMGEASLPTLRQLFDRNRHGELGRAVMIALRGLPPDLALPLVEEALATSDWDAVRFYAADYLESQPSTGGTALAIKFARSERAKDVREILDRHIRTVEEHARAHQKAATLAAALTPIAQRFAPDERFTSLAVACWASSRSRVESVVFGFVRAVGLGGSGHRHEFGLAALTDTGSRLYLMSFGLVSDLDIYQGRLNLDLIRSAAEWSWQSRKARVTTFPAGSLSVATKSEYGRAFLWIDGGLKTQLICFDSFIPGNVAAATALATRIGQPDARQALT